MSDAPQFVGSNRPQPEALRCAYRPVRAGPWADKLMSVAEELEPGAFEFKDPSHWMVEVVARGEVSSVERRAKLAGQLLMHPVFLSSKLHQPTEAEPFAINASSSKKRFHGDERTLRELTIVLRDGGEMWKQRESIKKAITAGTHRHDLDWHARFTPRIKVAKLNVPKVDNIEHFDEMLRHVPPVIVLGETLIRTVMDDQA